MCCVCQGNCNHVGDHVYCWKHGGNQAERSHPLLQFPDPPVIQQPFNIYVGLSDADVERVARRVVELLKAEGPLPIHSIPFTELDDELRYEDEGHR